jgi:hypothetical protein
MRPDRLVGGQVLGTADQEGWNPYRIMRPGFAQMYQMAAAGPRQTNIPDQTADMYAGMSGMQDGMGGVDRGDDKQYKPRKREQARQAAAKARADAPSRRAAPHATDEQLMGTAMQGMQYFEEFPEELQSPQEQRRERAASHGSLREQRGIAPEEPKATVDPQNLIGAGMAEELMNPRRQRRMQRERGPQPGLVPASDEE